MDGMKQMRGALRTIAAAGMFALALSATAQPRFAPSWDKGTFETRGALAERTGDAPAGGNDITGARAIAGPDALYVLIQCAEPVKAGNAWSFMVLLDTDMDRKTGYTAGMIGADYLAQVQGDLSSTLKLHPRRVGIDGGPFQGWEPQRLLADAVKINERVGYTPAHSVQIRIPWEELKIDGPQAARLRWRVCESSPELQADAGDWAPDLAEGYLSLGKDERSLARIPNALSNGDFEALNTALASPLPTDWGPFQAGTQTRIETVDRADDGGPVRHALRIASDAGQAAGVNGAPVAARRGVVTFRYKIDKSEAEGRNLGLQVIGLTGRHGQERYRFNWSPPAHHVGDGKWHTGSFDYRLPAGLEYALVAPRVNENTPAVGAADWTIDDVALYPIAEGVSVSIANSWAVDPLPVCGQGTSIQAVIENNSGVALEHVYAQLELTHATLLHGDASPAEQRLPRIEPGEFVRVSWPIDAQAAGEASAALKLAVRDEQEDFDAGTREAQVRLLFIDRETPARRTRPPRIQHRRERRLAPARTAADAAGGERGRPRGDQAPCFERYRA
jgi:hypothetical protein